MKNKYKTINDITYIKVGNHECIIDTDGWGNYEVALKVLTQLNEAIKEHPKCIINISK